MSEEVVFSRTGMGGRISVNTTRQPATAEEVGDDMIDAMFAPLPDNEESKPL